MLEGWDAMDRLVNWKLAGLDGWIAWWVGGEAGRDLTNWPRA
jgi:hypothetical protein